MRHAHPDGQRDPPTPILQGARRSGVPAPRDRHWEGEMATRSAARGVKITVPATWIASWTLYDLANTIWSYGIFSYAIGLYLTSEQGLGESQGNLWLQIAIALSVGVNALISPAIGAVSDRAGRRLPYLLFFTVFAIVPVLLNWLVPTCTVPPLVTIRPPLLRSAPGSPHCSGSTTPSCRRRWAGSRARNLRPRSPTPVGSESSRRPRGSSTPCAERSAR